MSQSPSTPVTNDQLIAAFEQLSADEKFAALEDLVYAFNQDLAKLKDPVLTRELDILDCILTNIDGRLDEIKRIYK